LSGGNLRRNGSVSWHFWRRTGMQHGNQHQRGNQRAKGIGVHHPHGIIRRLSKFASKIRAKFEAKSRLEKV